MTWGIDRKSTRLNSSHTEIYTLSLHDALPIYHVYALEAQQPPALGRVAHRDPVLGERGVQVDDVGHRSEEHTSELQSHRDLHSFPTRRSSDLPRLCAGSAAAAGARPRRSPGSGSG